MRTFVELSDLDDDLAAGAVAEHIGAHVRALREAMGLSLRDLAERSGVSAPMLSQVERGETSPTLTVAGRIASGLGLKLSQLLRLDEGEPVTIVRAANRLRGRKRAGHSYEVLTPELPGQRYEVSLHRLKAGTGTGGRSDSPIHEAGSRETLLIEKGTVSVQFDGGRHLLKEGDAITFDADLPHGVHNEGRGEAEFLAVVSAGLRSL